MIQPRHFRVAVALFLGLLVLTTPENAAEGARQGLAVCLQTVLPALFPFFVLCGWLTANLSARGFAAALGTAWLGGYAVCAQNLAALQKRQALTPRQAQMLLTAGCCSSPGFVIGCVGGQLLGSVRLGVFLYGLQLAANLLCAAAVALWLRPEKAPPRQVPPAMTPPRVGGGSFSAALDQAVNSCLAVCGCVLFFRIVYCTLAPLLPAGLRPFVSALLEISTGCTDFAARGGAAALYGCCLCLSVLGLSVFVQLHTFLGDDIRWDCFVLTRLLHAGIFLGTVRLLVPFLPGSTAVYSSLAPRVIPMNRLPPDTAVLIFLFFCAVLYKGREKLYNKRQKCLHRQAHFFVGRNLPK